MNKEGNSNYGTIFSLWARVLETLLSQIDQTRIKIGIGAYQGPEKIKFHHLLICLLPNL